MLTYADWLDNTKFDTSPPPYFDDGAAGSVYVFAANTAALASGTGATAGGTENSYPGATGGVVPASTSVAHEAAGTETSSTGAGNINYTYPNSGGARHQQDGGRWPGTDGGEHSGWTERKSRLEPVAGHQPDTDDDRADDGCFWSVRDRGTDGGYRNELYPAIGGLCQWRSHSDCLHQRYDTDGDDAEEDLGWAVERDRCDWWCRYHRPSSLYMDLT